MFPNVLLYEPHIALFVDNNDPFVFYRKIASLAEMSLKKMGKLYFECNEFNAIELQSLISKMKFTNVQIHSDVHGKNRILSAEKD